MYQKYSIAPIDSNELVPKYLIGENGPKKDTLGIVISLRQAQKIDYDYDLLNLYKGMHTDCDSTVNFLIQVVNNYKDLNVVAQARFVTDSLSIYDGKSQITNLKGQISLANAVIRDKNGIIRDKTAIINNNQLEIKMYKRERNRAIEIGSAVSAFLFWFVIGHPGIK